MRFLRLIAEAFAAEIERQTLERERARVAAEARANAALDELMDHHRRRRVTPLHKEMN